MNKKTIYFLMILVALGLSIKYIFIDIGIDAEYQISMAYRLATGDIMFKEMWEAHQTSAFLCAFLIKLYLLIFRTTTGIVLYLQLAGVLVDGAISYLLYRVVKKYLSSESLAFAMAWLFFVVSPKDMPIAEFANMQLWFSMLLCIMLFLYDETRKKVFLVLAALSLCGAVLSYPSCLLLVFGVAVLFWWRKDKAGFFLFMGVCAVTGIAYLCLILRNMSVTELLFCLENMLGIEPSHTVSLGGKFLAYALDALKILGVLAGLYGVAFLIGEVIGRLKGREKRYRLIYADVIFCVLTLGMCLYTVFAWQKYNRCCYSLCLLAAMLVGLRHVRKLSGSKQYLYRCGMAVSLSNFVATLVLTDLDLVTSVPYLLIAFVVALIPLWEVYQEFGKENIYAGLVRVALVCGVAFLTFRNVYIIRPMGAAHVDTILSVAGIVKDGPAIGMISEYMGPYMQNESLKEWEEYIEDGSNIYLIGGTIGTLGYLYGDTFVAAPSVMSTPWYNDCISAYWELHPDKYPDVVIASCWYGELDSMLEKNGWIMEWLEEDFKPRYSIDGKYWRYYFR